MSEAVVATGVTEVLEVLATDVYGAALTGLTDVAVYVRRSSDGYLLDWNDNTFKAAAWTTRQRVLTETDAVNQAGWYRYSWDMSTVVSPAANDVYTVTFAQTTLTNAANLPASGVVRTGRFVDTIASNLTVATSTLATSAEVAGIGTATGAALNEDAATDNYSGGISGVTSSTTRVGTQTNTYTATSALDGVYHVMTHAANALDIVYQFLTGGGTSPVGCTWTGYLSSSNDVATIYAWRFDTGAWEQVSTITGQAGTTNVVKTIPLFSRHAGTVTAELGKMYIRIQCTGTSPVLYTDQILTSYAVTSRTVGYANGAVWLDTTESNTSTEVYVDGTADNPVSTLAAALTVAAGVSLHKITVANGSTVTLASTLTNYTLVGDSWTLALGGQSTPGTKYMGASNGVSGTVTGAGIFFYECSIGNVTAPPAAFQTCGFSGTLTVGSAGDYYLVDCFSQVAGGATPVLDMAGVGAANVSIRRWSGGLTVNNIAAGDVLSIDVVTGGTVTLNGANGDVKVRGICNVTDNRTGAPTLTQTSVLNQTTLATPTNITAGTITTVGTVNAIGADAITASALAASAVTEVQSGLATSAALATAQADITTIVGRVDVASSTLATSAALAAVATDTTKSRRALWNRRALTSLGVFTLYADDAVTPLATATVTDKDGAAITLATGDAARTTALA